MSLKNDVFVGVYVLLEYPTVTDYDSNKSIVSPIHHLQVRNVR